MVGEGEAYPLDVLRKAKRLIVKSWSPFDDDTIRQLVASDNFPLRQISLCGMRFDNFRELELPDKIELKQDADCDFYLSVTVRGKVASCSVFPKEYADRFVIQYDVNQFLPVTISNSDRSINEWLARNTVVRDKTKKLVVGFDAEFDPVTHITAICQLCIGKECLVIDLTRRHTIPTQLKRMFTVDAEKYLFVGNGVKADIVKLKEWANDNLWVPTRLFLADLLRVSKMLESKEASEVRETREDKAEEEVERSERKEVIEERQCEERTTKPRLLKDLEFAGCGLQDLSKTAVGTTIKPTRHISGWRNKPLSKEQVVYAAFDAWAGKAVWEVFSEFDKDLSFIKEVTV